MNEIALTRKTRKQKVANIVRTIALIGGVMALAFGFLGVFIRIYGGANEVETALGLSTLEAGGLTIAGILTLGLGFWERPWR